MALFTVTISGVTNPVEIYGGITNAGGANDYINAMIGQAAASWAALPSDAQPGLPSKARIAVLGSRLMDTQDWQGTAFPAGNVGTTLQWPRTNVVNPDGSAVSSASVPQLIVNAAFELYAILAMDPELYSLADTASNVQAIGVGPSRIQLFAPTSIAGGTASVLPTPVYRLISQWLASALPSTVLGGLSFGGVIVNADGTTTEDSYFDTEDQGVRTWPF